MPNSIFFSQFAADCQSENSKYKNWMCNAQIQKDKVKGRVVVKKYLNKCWLSVNFLCLIFIKFMFFLAVRHYYAV